MSKMIRTTLIAILILFIILELSDARGGRGGGGRSGSRGSRSRGSRVRSSASRYRSKYSSYRLSSKSSIRNAVLLGTVYGATRWKVRRSYRSDSSRMPEICYNDKYVTSETGNISYYGRFVCPLDETMGEDYRYCCGEEGKQYCCTFWDNGGRVAGVVIGIIIFAIIVFVVFFCLYKNCKNKRHSSSSSSSSHAKGYTPQPLRSAVYSPPNELQTNMYSTQPVGDKSSSVMPPPPAYDAATSGNGALPYDLNPGGYPPYQPNQPNPDTGYQPSYGFEVKQQVPITAGEGAYTYAPDVNKSSLPPGEVSDGLPNPANPGYPPTGGPTAPPYSAPPYPINN